MNEQSDYLKYRGKCKELSEAAIALDPTLRLVRGHYYCPMWGQQDHWWCEKPDGTIVDPSVNQFPSKGMGEYEEFNGVCECAQCGKEVSEDEAILEGRYALCSENCRLRFVGLESFIRIAA